VDKGCDRAKFEVRRQSKRFSSIARRIFRVTTHHKECLNAIRFWQLKQTRDIAVLDTKVIVGAMKLYKSVMHLHIPSPSNEKKDYKKITKINRASLVNKKISPLNQHQYTLYLYSAMLPFLILLFVWVFVGQQH
jgi:hypothetical protein